MTRRFLKSRGFTLIELMIVVAIIGILAALAIPNFIKFQAKSKQSEAKSNLKTVFTTQKSHYGEANRYGSMFSDIGFAPEGSNRYAYELGTTAKWTRDAANLGVPPAGGYDYISQDTSKGDTLDYSTLTAVLSGSVATGVVGTGAVGVEGTCPACEFGAYAIGNLDSDTLPDEWAIFSYDINTVGGAKCNSDTTLASGQPYNYYNDVDCNS